MDNLSASKYGFQKGKLYMHAQCIPVCTCTEKTHSSAGLCWFTLVHMALSAINGGFTFISFDRFLISLSNFQTHWCRRHSIGSFPPETWSEQANCIFVVIIYIALKTRPYIEIMSFFGDFYFKGVHEPFCHSFVRQKPLLVLCLSFVRPQSDPAGSLIDCYLDKCERCPLFVM